MECDEVGKNDGLGSGIESTLTCSLSSERVEPPPSLGGVQYSSCYQMAMYSIDILGAKTLFCCAVVWAISVRP
jgi:hypothetical protein